MVSCRHLLSSSVACAVLCEFVACVAQGFRLILSRAVSFCSAFELSSETLAIIQGRQAVVPRNLASSQQAQRVATATSQFRALSTRIADAREDIDRHCGQLKKFKRSQRGDLGAILVSCSATRRTRGTTADRPERPSNSTPMCMLSTWPSLDLKMASTTAILCFPSLLLPLFHRLAPLRHEQSAGRCHPRYATPAINSEESSQKLCVFTFYALCTRTRPLRHSPTRFARLNSLRRPSMRSFHLYRSTETRSRLH